jgi:hypothetical protein
MVARGGAERRVKRIVRSTIDLPLTHTFTLAGLQQASKASLVKSPQTTRRLTMEFESKVVTDHS